MHSFNPSEKHIVQGHGARAGFYGPPVIHTIPVKNFITNFSLLVLRFSQLEFNV
jgi:hypothetical protein